MTIPEAENEVFTALERLAAHCPWERTDIWVCRQPSGEIEFTAYADGVSEVHLASAFGHGSTPIAAVEQLIKEHPDRDIDRFRKEEIAKLQRQIEKLKQIQVSLPPYRPTPLIGVGKPEEAAPPLPPRFINVEAQDVTF